jgi:hypothetical protein
MTYLVRDIRDHLDGSQAIRSEVSDRIFPDRIPQRLYDDQGRVRDSAFPCIVIGEISGTPEYTLAGEAGVHMSTVQIDVWTDGRKGPQETKDIAEAVRNRLSGYRGTLGSGVHARNCMLVRNDTSTIAPFDGSDNFRRRASMDFRIIHSADVPTFT